MAPSLRHWIEQAQVESGLRVGVTTEDRQRLVELENACVTPACFADLSCRSIEEIALAAVKKRVIICKREGRKPRRFSPPLLTG